jgi:hypothetical protein
MTDGFADFDIGFHQRPPETFRIAACNVGPIEVAYEIIAEFNAVFLKQQNGRAAAGSI